MREENSKLKTQNAKPWARAVSENAALSERAAIAVTAFSHGFVFCVLRFEFSRNGAA